MPNSPGHSDALMGVVVTRPDDDFNEFEQHINQVIYVSATPGAYEYEHSAQIVQQVVRPTGLIDPTIEIKPTTGQIDDLLDQIKKRTDPLPQ